MKKRVRFRIGRRGVIVLLLVLVVSATASYFLVPELLVWSGGLLIAEVEPKPADAIVVLAGGGPDRPREAAELFRTGLAPRVLITTEEAPEGNAELARLGVDLVLAHENYLRVLHGLGVPEEDVLQILSPATETIDEVTKIREFSESRGWRRLIIVTSNYHTRRTSLVSRYVFDDGWDISVVGSRYGEFRPNQWWTDVRHTRTFFIEFQRLLVYWVYLGPWILF